MNLTYYIPIVSAVVLSIIGVFFYGWIQILKQTNTLLKDQNTELKSSHADMTQKINEYTTQLSSLQGQIDVLKSIPLTSIDSTLKELTKITEGLTRSNNLILQSITSSAIILATENKKDLQGNNS